MTSTVIDPSATLRGGVASTYAAFVGQGLLTSTFASRIPQIRSERALEPSQLGLVLLAIAAGSVLALPTAGPLIGRLGSRRVVTLGSLLAGGAFVVDAVGYAVGLPVLVAGMVLQGVGLGAWDVAMNVHGAQVERQLGRPIMPRFHAGFSVGTVAGALLGAGAVAVGLPVPAHFAIVGVLVAAVVLGYTRRFLIDEADEVDGADEADGVDAVAAAGVPVGLVARLGVGLQRWREPRTLLIGLFVLAFAFTEGTGNDWISLAVIDGYHASATVGTLTFATFLAAMTAGRWFGPSWLHRGGRLRLLRLLGAVALIGLGLFVAGLALPLAFVGALLWGLGTSLGFPVGMSAGADEPSRAAGRVSVIASIGYLGFLGGPPFIGFLGNHVGVLHSLIAPGVLLAIAFVVAPALRPIGPAAASDQR